VPIPCSRARLWLAGRVFWSVQAADGGSCPCLSFDVESSQRGRPKCGRSSIKDVRPDAMK
jgi:hypothetical protein